MVSEVSPGAAGEGKACHRRRGGCLFTHLRIQLPQVEVNPLGDLCWSVLWSTGISARSGLGGCVAWQPAPHLAGDHEMSLQVQPEPENPLNLQSI